MPDDLLVEVSDRLDALHELPTAEHVEIFDGIHRTLQDALAALDEV